MNESWLETLLDQESDSLWDALRESGMQRQDVEEALEWLAHEVETFFNAVERASDDE